MTARLAKAEQTLPPRAAPPTPSTSSALDAETRLATFAERLTGLDQRFTA